VTVELSVADGEWAWTLGLSYGGWWPDLDAELRDVADALTDWANPTLNDVAARVGFRALELPEDTEVTADHVPHLLPYLAELTRYAAWGCEAAIKYRRSVCTGGGRDPRLLDGDPARLRILARDVDGYLEENPGLRFHMVGGARTKDADVREVSTSAKVDPPAAQPFGVSHQGAELLVAAWMRHLGVPEAAVTRFTADGGIDVQSVRFVAQVKNYDARLVPIESVRALLGSAVDAGRTPLLFTSSGVSAEGAAFADRVNMAVFRYDAVRGTLVGLNRLARAAVASGLPTAYSGD
jgi:hypothetical protein